jgi:hypothetical protein
LGRNLKDIFLVSRQREGLMRMTMISAITSFALLLSITAETGLFGNVNDTDEERKGPRSDIQDGNV